MTLAVAPEKFVVPAGDEGGPMTSGASYSGSLTGGDIDQFSFTAKSGDYFRVAIGNRSSSPYVSIKMNVITPNGTDWNTGNSVGAWGTAPQSGLYTVVVSSWMPFRLMAATSLAWSLRLDPLLFLQMKGGPVTNGQSYAGKLPTGDIDAYAFVRREVALLIVLTVLAGQDRLFHQPCPKEEMR